MERRESGLVLSATDLSKHLACAHVTEVDRARAERRLDAEPWRDPAVEFLQERGLAHEHAYVEELRAQGKQVVELRELDSREPRAEARAREAMQSGAEVIVQAPLSRGRWRGVADLLVRVEKRSALGEWSYEVVDTKLASETSGGTVLQLSLYSDLLGEAQGLAPRSMHVVKPGRPFERETFRCADFAAYYETVKARLEAATSRDPTDIYARTYPEPRAHCDVCRWWRLCDTKRREDDHLSLVAGMGAAHRTELRGQGRGTLEEFARATEPLRTKPARGNRETYERLHRQAVIQLQGRTTEERVFELIPREDRRGLSLLPAPDPGDVYFDIEGDHFHEEGGLEYLFGVSFEEDGQLEYRAFWALDRAEEKRAFENLIDFLLSRWERFPEMHVYHFHHYEPSAVKRLMGRHSTRQLEVDRLLRAERFVDLHAATRQGVRASVESYNLKDLELFAGYERAVDLREASAQRRKIAYALERGDREGITSEIRDPIEGYNREDCEATRAMQTWLEERRAELVEQEGPFPRPGEEDEQDDGAPSEKRREQWEKIKQVVDRLRAELPEDPAGWTAEERATNLLADLLPYFFREDRCSWWERLRLLGLDADGRLDERKAIEGLHFEADLGPPTERSRLPVHRYRFPTQEVAMKTGTDLLDLDGDKIGTVVRVDQAEGTVEVHRTKKTVNRHATAAVAYESVPSGSLEDSLLAFGLSVAEHGIAGDGPFRAARRLLMSLGPSSGAALRRDDESAFDAARRLASELTEDVLAIQGPPGTGKTFTGARMIIDLVRAGKRVGVTAVSHRVIHNLVRRAVTDSRAEDMPGEPIRGTLKVSKPAEEAVDGLTEVKDKGEALDALDRGEVVGGTAWLWTSNPFVENPLDVLFVDEAGQLSLAMTLAAARCAKSLVLLGDPQQLQQPQQAAHPEGAEIAALEHFLDGRETMPPEKGLFLEETWRLHPDITRFTSELYYEGRLESHATCGEQALFGSTPFVGAGLFRVPIEHAGQSSRSLEEVDEVERIVKELLAGGISWSDREGNQHDLEPRHVLVVAPYNAQVGALIDRLTPLGVSAGTVDKFQGQEAPVVIYSTTSSSVEEAPRGMSFLFDPHRLNVATSRAQCACILVYSPALTNATCRSPVQMRWANGLCAYVARAREVSSRRT